MREKSFVPTNLFTSHKLADALPEVKLVAASIWISPHLSCVGVGEIPLAPLAATVGLAKEQTATALRLLEQAEAIAMDPETGEIFILDWFRFNTFKKGVAAEIARKQIEKIKSERIKALVAEKSKGCLPTAAATATPTSSKEEEGQNKPKAAAAPQHKKRRVTNAGIVCWDLEDERKAAQLESSISNDVLAIAISNLVATSKEPLPGRVEKEAEKITRKLQTDKGNKNAATQNSFIPNIESQKKGEAIIKRVRNSLKPNSPPPTH